jgi:hypothetical protein
MRMWMVDPKILCQQHLLGEHVELHMLVGSIKRGKSIDGFILNGLIEPKSIVSRHEELVKEMIRRDINHKSGIVEKVLGILVEKYPKYKDFSLTKEQKSRSLEDLLKRCTKCQELFKKEILKNALSIDN